MDQDAEDRFDENDIAFPAGVDFRYRLYSWLEPALSLSAFRTRNSNSWTPKVTDTLIDKKHANTYSLTAFHTSLAFQLNIPRDILTLDNFHRLWFGFAADFFPYVLFHTERTLLSGGVRARGLGYGGTLSVGAERFFENKISFFGEMGFGVRSFQGFAEGGRTVAESDIMVNGGGQALAVDFRSLFFKFGYGRWF